MGLTSSTNEAISLIHPSPRRVREALWAYHRGLERLGQADETLGQMMQTNLSRRAIRTSVPDEMGSFVRWVGRKPHETRPFINAHFIYQEEGVRDSDYEEREDDDRDEAGEG